MRKMKKKYRFGFYRQLTDKKAQIDKLAAGHTCMHVSMCISIVIACLSYRTILSAIQNRRDDEFDQACTGMDKLLAMHPILKILAKLLHSLSS